jgi:chitodextrinase
VRQQARTSTSVLVQWDPSATGPTVDRYLILRDGVQVGSVPGTETSYKDKGLSPATVYEYRVVALSGDVRSAPSTILLVKTLLPPI